MAEIVWGGAALGDISEIFDYIANENPRAALKSVKRIGKVAAMLATHPRMGRPGRVPGTRELAIAGTPYLLVYRFQRNTVRIGRVLHGARRRPIQP